jgi:hypothetical protein
MSAIKVNTITPLSGTHTSGSFNGVFSGSIINDRIDKLEIFSSSLDITFATDAQLYSLYQTTASLNSKTGSYAITGSNVFRGQQVVSGSVLISGSLVPATGQGTFTSSFSLGSATNAWKDIYVSQGSIIFVDAITQATSSFSITTDIAGEENTIQYSAAITASKYFGDGGGLYNLPSNTNWNKDKEYIVRNTEQLSFSGDYILEYCALLIEGSDEEVEYSSNKSFKREGTIFIGGNLLLKDSYIQNDGKISVGGEVILIGNSQIVGNGIII